MAKRAGVLCHVDACLGGFVLPFARQLGYPIPAFDFAVPGVTSMSVDTHKFGMAHKGTSVVLYHNKDLRRFQYTSITEWSGGLYISPGGRTHRAWLACCRFLKLAWCTTCDLLLCLSFLQRCPRCQNVYCRPRGRSCALHLHVFSKEGAVKVKFACMAAPPLSCLQDLLAADLGPSLPLRGPR